MEEIKVLKEIYNGVKNGINPITFDHQLNDLNVNQLTLLLKFINDNTETNYNFYRTIVIDKMYEKLNTYSINYDLEEE